jgi:Domain of unknown function (DUF4389)
MDDAPAGVYGFQHPIRLHVDDDLRRTRLTAFFRLLLALPHFLWLALLSIVAFLAAIGNWFATLFQGRSPVGLHAFLAGYLRYSTHVTAYAYLIADPFPGFYLINMKPQYPIDLEVDGPMEQNRWTVGFRILLAIPALFVANILRNLSGLLAIFSWVLAVLTARVPEGIRNFAALALRYEAQTYGYVLLLSPRYPSFDVNIES